MYGMYMCVCVCMCVYVSVCVCMCNLGDLVDIECEDAEILSLVGALWRLRLTKPWDCSQLFYPLKSSNGFQKHSKEHRRIPNPPDNEPKKKSGHVGY